MRACPRYHVWYQRKRSCTAPKYLDLGRTHSPNEAWVAPLKHVQYSGGCHPRHLERVGCGQTLRHEHRPFEDRTFWGWDAERCVQSSEARQKLHENSN